MTAGTDEAVSTSDFDQMVELLTHEIAAHVWPDRCFDPEFVGSLGLSVRDNVRAMLATVEGTLDLVEANPQGAFAFAELSAELGIPVSELESAYWVGARGIWREWFAQTRSAGDRSAGDQLDQVGKATMLIFDYVIHILGAVVARYDVTRAEILRNREDRRRAVLGQILDGSITQSTTEAESALGYRLRGTHVALTLKVDERAQAERAAAGLAEATGADSSMMLLHAPGTWMLWLGFLRPLKDRQVADLAAAAAAAGVEMAVGDPGSGIEGLRRTSEQALAAVRLRRRVPGGLPLVVWYSDVRIELLLLHDEQAARGFVTDELGELADYDERADRTCETLLAWLASGSQMDAAAQLGVHKNTMRLRIGHAEQVLGHRLSHRRPEISVALRLRELLRPRPLTGRSLCD